MLLLGFLLFFCLTEAVPGDEITALPGWSGPLPSRHFSGYLDISPTKHIHYWMVESEDNPANDPIAVWLNGGPGCSSLDGFIYEHGPFRLNYTDPNTWNLYRFEDTWASHATMVYLEAPVGVGYSYSDDPSEYNVNDDITAQDNLAAVEKLFELYPQFAQNEFFIAGESYGGVYVPTMAEAVVKATLAGTYKGAPLKGIAVGNGCTGNEIGVCGGQRDIFMTTYLLGQAFAPKSLKDKIVATCDFNRSLSIHCKDLITEMQANIGDVDLYNIYGDCLPAPSSSESAPMLRAPLGATELYGLGRPGPVACINSVEASAYFNDPAVVKAMHVKPIDFTWEVCGTAKGWHYKSTRPNLPRDTYPLLTDHLRVVIYNGDWDACVPYTDNEAWTEGMGYQVAHAWHPWMYKNGKQVAGYATVYARNNFTFLTIKGGRHETPETAPGQALEMFTRLITNKAF